MSNNGKEVSTVGLQVIRTIPKEAGVITEAMVNELKDDILTDLGDDLIDLLNRLGWIAWHIDAERRTISADVPVHVESDT